MIKGITPGTGDEQRDKSREVNEGHLAVALADQTAAMDDKERHRHGYDKRNEGEACGQASHEQDGAEDLRKDHEVKAHGRTDPERIRERGCFVGHALHFAPAVQQKHGQSEPDPQDQQSDILEPLTTTPGDPLRVRFDHGLESIRPVLEQRRK